MLQIKNFEHNFALMELIESYVTFSIGKTMETRRRGTDNLSRAPLHDTQQSNLYPSVPQKTPPASRRSNKKLYPSLPAQDENSRDDSLDNLSDSDELDGSEIEEIDGEKPRITNRVLDKKNEKKMSPKPTSRNRRRKPGDTGHISQSYDVNNTGVRKENDTKPFWLILAVVIVCFGVLIYMIRNSERDADLDTSQPVDYYKLFSPKFDEIKTKYKSQSPRFWKIIGSSVKRLLSAKVATYPAVIIITVPNDYSQVGTCIAKEIVTCINSVYNSTGVSNSYINSQALDSVNVAKTKFDLDERLISTLSEGRAVVLDHIDTLPADAALLLHSYADGDNAPYKNAALFLVFHTDNSSELLSENFVEKSLTDLWGPVLGVDEMPALLSRIANSIAILSPENNASCN